jgi:hypothetical protein
MNKILVYTAPILILALLATLPRFAYAQKEGDGEFPPVKMVMDYKPGMQIEADRLGEFVTKSLKVEFGNSETKEFSVKLRVELLSREKGVVGVYDSNAADCFPTRYYPASTWIHDPGNISEKLAPGFGDRRKITVGRTVVINHEEQYVARECEGATHAMQLTLMSTGRQASGLPTGKRQVCLTTGR